MDCEISVLVSCRCSTEKCVYREALSCLSSWFSANPMGANCWSNASIELSMGRDELSLLAWLAAAGPQVRQLRESLSGAQQRATAAEAKVELLQEAVRKAEERAARLEMERNSRTPQAAGEVPAA